MNFNHDTLLLIFVFVTALAFVLQVFILLGILIAAGKGTKAIKEEMEQLRSTVTPLINTTQENLGRIGPAVESVIQQSRTLLTHISPPVESTATDFSKIVHNLREETEKLETVMLELMERVRNQSSRIDGMVTGMLNNVNRAGEFVAEAVNRPVKQAQGIIASIKAAVDSFNSPVPPRNADDHHEDETFARSGKAI